MCGLLETQLNHQDRCVSDATGGRFVGSTVEFQVLIDPRPFIWLLVGEDGLHNQHRAVRVCGHAFRLVQHPHHIPAVDGDSAVWPGYGNLHGVHQRHHRYGSHI